MSVDKTINLSQHSYTPNQVQYNFVFMYFNVFLRFPYYRLKPEINSSLKCWPI